MLSDPEFFECELLTVSREQAELAASEVSGCEACSESAEIPFDWILADVDEPSRHVRVRHACAREVSAVSCSGQRKDAGRAAGWHCCGIVDEVSSAPLFPARMERWHFQKMEEDLRKHASQEPQFRRSSWDRGTLIQSELSPRYFLVLNQRATTSPMNRSGRPHSHV